MDFKDLAGNIAKGTATVAVATVQIAGKGICEGGKLAKKGIGSACDTISEDRKMMAEIRQIDTFCTNTAEDIEQQ